VVDWQGVKIFGFFGDSRIVQTGFVLLGDSGLGIMLDCVVCFCLSGVGGAIWAGCGWVVGSGEEKVAFFVTVWGAGSSMEVGWRRVFFEDAGVIERGVKW
jgi:hypothetical protein